MNYLLFLTIVSSICSVLSLLITIFAKYSWGKRILWFIVVFVLTFISGYAVNRNSEYERIRNIHRQAKAICEHSDSSFHNVFIQESLAFLEENRDKYPDSYDRANLIYKEMKSSNYSDEYGAAREMYGIIKGIATLNGD